MEEQEEHTTQTDPRSTTKPQPLPSQFPPIPALGDEFIGVVAPDIVSPVHDVCDVADLLAFHYDHGAGFFVKILMISIFIIPSHKQSMSYHVVNTR